VVEPPGEPLIRAGGFDVILRDKAEEDGTDAKR